MGSSKQQISPMPRFDSQATLSDRGKVLMPLDKYRWNQKYRGLQEADDYSLTGSPRAQYRHRSDGQARVFKETDVNIPETAWLSDLKDANNISSR